MRANLVEWLARFIYEVKYEDLPSEVVEKAKTCFLDYVGVALAGSQTEFGKTITKLVKRLGGVSESTIIGDGSAVPSVNAAYVNGALAHIHELDDGHRVAMGHPGAPVISAALAVSEKVDASGKELIEAIVIGYDIFIRIGAAVNPSHFRRGFHTTSTCGVLGAAAAAGKLLDLDVDRLANALGIAATQASGLMEVTRGESVIKPLQPARAAQSGVLSALLAQSGLTAPKTMLDGESGFLRAYSDGYDVRKITEGLGATFRIMEVYFKFHASCRHTHPAIDAVLELRRRYGISPEDVREVEVKTYSAAYELCGREYTPKTVSAAKFSIPYCVAIALAEGQVSPGAFTENKIRDSNILTLARKVRVVLDPELDRLVPAERGARVKLVLKDGRSVETLVRNPYGEPETSPTNNDIKNKFISLTSGILDSQRTAELLGIIDHLDDIRNIKLITDRLRTIA
ncbi:MAG: MmgE/PrpD family protein [Sulfolobales archaeon]